LYGLLTNKLNNHSYVIDNYLLKNKKRLIIGSVDIGAGTTDLIINYYTEQVKMHFKYQNFIKNVMEKQIH
jgi:hypothetical protein